MTIRVSRASRFFLNSVMAASIDSEPGFLPLSA